MRSTWPRGEPAWSTAGVWIFDWILDGRGIQDVLLHTTPTGRWSFHDITEKSFLWRGHVSADDGTTSHHEQEMRARRRTAGS